jgi:hypothetical protein
MSAKTYTGPSVADMVRDKTLAENIIKYHDHPTSDQILDDHNMNLLQRFVQNPNDRDQLLQEEGIDGNKPLKGRQASLAAYVIWAHGKEEADGGMLTEGDIERMRKWFASGKSSSSSV